MSAQTTSHTPWELGVAYILHLWPVLTLAVNSQWGGPHSEEKREWLCGAIADMFPSLDSSAASASTSSNPGSADGIVEPDDYDVEETLAQVMLDEFEVAVEDDSSAQVAKQIIHLRAALLQGNFAQVDLLREKFEKNKTKPVPVAKVEGDDEDEEAEDSDEDEEEEGSDEEMGDAEVFGDGNGGNGRIGPVVDEDGFELVQSRRRR